MKKLLKFLLPISILIFGVVVVLGFEFYIKPRVNTVPVVVAKQDIPFKSKITKENLTIVNVKKDHIVKNAFTPTDVQMIVGSYAAIHISKGTQIYPNLIDQFDLVPDETNGEFVAPIPTDWLFAVPGSLRKTFIADFYAIPNSEQAAIRTLIKEKESRNDTKKEQNEGKEREVIETNDSIDNVVTDEREPVLKNVRVSSVKDRSNREVTEAKEEAQTTGVISNLEIIATEEMLNTLRDYTEKGYKLYVVYKFQRSK
ncbi:MAG TPA: SAF domain-containing protein [Metabacillus sp.]|nr:SAF domain-containing protein [Metabacillus sp.]